jgi:hypothetical protein
MDAVGILPIQPVREDVTVRVIDRNISVMMDNKTLVAIRRYPGEKKSKGVLWIPSGSVQDHFAASTADFIAGSIAWFAGVT